jgi:S1-C subfamily serine protease
LLQYISIYASNAVVFDAINITNEYQTTATVSHGNSGGPLFDEDGNIIGINAFILTSNLARNVNYTIKIRCVVDLVENSGLRINIPQNQNRSFNFWNTNSSLA